MAANRNHGPNDPIRYSQTQPGGGDERVVSIEEIPVDVAVNSEIAMHIDMHLTRGQARTLRQLTTALDRRGEKLSTAGGNKPIRSYSAAIRWLLERLEASAGQSPTGGADPSPATGQTTPSPHPSERKRAAGAPSSPAKPARRKSR